MLQSVLLYLFYMLLVFVLLSYSISDNNYLTEENSKNISDDDSYSTQGEPSGEPEDPKSNKPNKSSELENSNSLAKSPVYPHTPVKVYHDASVSKFDIYKDFKDVSIIYM